MIEKICDICNKKFITKYKQQKHCGDICTLQFKRIYERHLYNDIYKFVSKCEIECIVCKNKFLGRPKRKCCSKECSKKYERIYARNFDKQWIRNWRNNWHNKNKEKISKVLSEKYKNDLNYRLRRNITNRIKFLITCKNSDNKKYKHTLELLGCSIEYLKQYLQNQFRDGMTWENHSHFGWHIDHKIPVSSFNLSKLEEQQKCFHYSNLQPLWWYENLQKSNKIKNDLIKVEI